MVIRKFKYTPEDVDCQFCTEFIHGRCRAQKCPWMKERVEAGVITYQEAVREAFDERSPYRFRVQFVLSFYNKFFWKDEAHFQRFERLQAILGYYKKRNTDAYYAALYLLGSDEELLVRAIDCFTKKQINFDKYNTKNISPDRYALYKIAKSLYTDSAEVGVDELADPELVSTESFHLVVNAMLIYRYGLSALSLKSEDGGYGAF